MDSQCSIELFGGIRVTQGKRVITRFRTQKTAALLAYLAFFGDRMHSREVLIDLLWPQVPMEAGRISLSVALSSLRSQLEPPDVPAHSLLLADRKSIGLSSLVVTDTARFEIVTRDAERARSRKDRDDEKRLLLSALSLYRERLLPGHYEGWIVPQQERLSAQYRLAVRRLADLYEEDGDLDAAIACAQRAVQSDPSDEEVTRDLIRLLLKNGGASGDPGSTGSSNAIKQYRQLEKALRTSGHAPSAKTRSLIAPLLKDNPVSESASSRRPRTAATGATAVAVRKSASVFAVASTSPEITASASTAVKAFQSPQITSPDPIPNPLTRFFGRQEELALITQLLHSGENRLITLTGPGGTGKTRIALEIARRQRQLATDQAQQEISDDAEPDREDADAPEVYFVPLIEAVTAELFIAALRTSLGIREDKRQADPLSTLVSELQGRRLLLVLDNFEQIPEMGAELLERLMERVPGLTCLITSRQRLSIAGELSVPIDPFVTSPPSKQLPAQRGPGAIPEGDWDLTRLLESQPAVALFVNRAQGAKSDFQITRRNADNIVELVHRLEGIPLAIELAAARTQVLTPRQMLDRLEKRLDLLVHHRKVAGGRHHSLRETLQLSYDLLSPALRKFFTDLAVFRGGFTTEAAEAVTTNAIALDLLAQLCDASLIRSVGQADGEVRFQMLETVREFAREKQEEDEESSREREGAEIRHLTFFAQYAEIIDDRLTNGGVQHEALTLLEAEHDNFRAALRRSLRRSPDSSTATESLRLLASLHNFWMIRGHFTEGRSWGRKFWERLRDHSRRPAQSSTASANRPLVAKAINGAGVLAMSQGDYAAADRCYRCSLWLRRYQADRSGIAATLNNAGISRLRQRDATGARALYEKSLKEWRSIGNKLFIARLVANIGVIAAEQQDYAVAQKHFAESIETARYLNYTRGVALGLCNIGHVFYKTTDYASAEIHLTESLSTAQEIKDYGIAAAALLCLGFVRSAHSAAQVKSETLSQAELETGPQFLRIAVESYQELNLPLPEYAAGEMEHFPPAVSKANGFSSSGLQALQEVLERWLPEHAL